LPVNRVAKILIVDPLGLSPFYDQYLSTALADRGHDVELWIREPEFLPGYFDNRKFRARKVTHVSRRLFPGNSAVAKFFKYAELLLIDYPRIVTAALRAGIVHVQWLSPPPIADVELWYWRVVQLSGKKVIFTAHNVFPLGKDRTVTAHLKRRYALFNRIIVTSDYGKKIIRQYFPPVSPKTAMISHGPFFHDATRIPADQARSRLNLPPSRPIVLYQGFFSPHKGVEFLLDAFLLVVKKHPDALLLLVGGGDALYRSKISAQLQQGAIPSRNVSTRFELIPIPELILYYAASDIVVYPYKDIYQSGALFTGFGLGKAIVATRVGGLPEVIHDGANGRLVDYGDIDNLAKSIDELIASPTEREMLGRKAHATAVEEYGWDTIGRTLEEVYKRATETR